MMRILPALVLLVVAGMVLGSVSVFAQKYKVRTAPADFLSKTNPFTSEKDIKDGAKQYKGKCADCHGAKGEGDPEEPHVVAFTNKAWMQTRSDGQLFYITLKGGGSESEMEAWGPDTDAGLSEKKIWQIIAYIRTLAK